MSYQYHKDEYGAKVQRDLAYMTNIVDKGIQNDNMYKMVINDHICRMAQVISGDFNFSPITQLFTKQGLRNKRYGTTILSLLTQKLLSEGHQKVGLLADTENTGSLKILKRQLQRNIQAHPGKHRQKEVALKLIKTWN